MAAVTGYVVVATIAVALALRIAGPPWTVRRDPTFELQDVAGRLVGVMSGLAGVGAGRARASRPGGLRRVGDGPRRLPAARGRPSDL